MTYKLRLGRLTHAGPRPVVPNKCVGPLVDKTFIWQDE